MTEQCEKQSIAFCECKKFAFNYTTNLVILNLITINESTRSLGSRAYDSINLCEQEIKKFSICNL